MAYSQTQDTANSAASNNTASSPQWFYQELIELQKDINQIKNDSADEKQVRDLQERLVVLKSELQQQSQSIDGRLNDQNNRVGDIYASIDRFSIIVTILGLFASALAIFVAQLRAVRKAKAEANEIVTKWKAETEVEIKKSFSEKLEALAEDHEKQFAKIREETEMQNATNEINEAYNHVNNDRIGDALSRINRQIQRYQKSDTTTHHEIVAKSLFAKALIYYKDKKPEQEIQVYDQLLSQFKDNAEPAIQEGLAKALMNKAVTLGQLEKPEEAIKVYDQLLSQFKDNAEPIIQEQLFKALFNKALALGQLDKPEEAIKVYDQLLSQFKDNAEPAIQHQIVGALCNKTEMLLLVDDLDAMVQSAQEVIECIRDKDYPEERAVIELLLFIASQTTVDHVLEQTLLIPNEVELTWGFKEIRSHIDSLESPKKEQVTAFVKFYEEYKDKAQLKAELEAVK
jgi:tetratricopeptide (TPR) repeat protein